jgi:hypothetical protein
MAMTQAIAEQPKKRSLASIVDEMLDVIDESDGQVTARIDELGLELDAKVEAYGAVIARLKAEKAAITALIEGYEQKVQARENQIVGLIFRLAGAMEAVGVDKLKTPTTTAYFQKSTAVRIPDEDAFAFNAPDRFVVTTHRPNKKAIRDALDAGEAVEGAELITTRSLRLR